MDPAQQSELDWLAFRYVAGEMTADEAGAFEERLAGDQDAREAVSRAVQLTERLAEAAPALAAVDMLSKPAGPEKCRPHAPREGTRHAERDACTEPVWRRSLLRAAPPLAWMAAGAAAALLAVSLLGRAAPRADESGPAAGPHAAPDHRTAANPALWARLQAGGQWASPDLARWLEESTTTAGQERDDALEPAEVPSWIFATTNSRPK